MAFPVVPCSRRDDLPAQVETETKKELQPTAAPSSASSQADAAGGSMSRTLEAVESPELTLKLEQQQMQHKKERDEAKQDCGKSLCKHPFASSHYGHFGKSHLRSSFKHHVCEFSLCKHPCSFFKHHVR